MEETMMSAHFCTKCPSVFLFPSAASIPWISWSSCTSSSNIEKSLHSWNWASCISCFASLAHATANSRKHNSKVHCFCVLHTCRVLLHLMMQFFWSHCMPIRGAFDEMVTVLLWVRWRFHVFPNLFKDKSLMMRNVRKFHFSCWSADSLIVGSQIPQTMVVIFVQLYLSVNLSHYSSTHLTNPRHERRHSRNVGDDHSLPIFPLFLKCLWDVV